jgi:hypothetical protein
LIASTAFSVSSGAVQEVGDVRILFGFRHAQLRAAGAGDDLAQDIGQRLRREDRLHHRVEFIAVLRHADGAGNLDVAATCKTGPGRRVEQDAEQLPDAVGAEIEAENAVAALHAAVVADHRGQDEFIELPL